MRLTHRQTQNFWSKVVKTQSCWNWAGYKSGGYGKINLNGKVYLAHRISALLNGEALTPLKDKPGAGGDIVMHSCDNRACVNPEHLTVSTQQENVLDAIRKGRFYLADWAGDKNPHARVNQQRI